MHANYVTEGCVIKEIHGEDSFMAQQGFQVGDIIVQWETFRFPNHMALARTFKAPPHPAAGMLRFGVTYNSPGPDMLIVHYVEPGATADKLGIKEGDMIASWQGEEKADGRFLYDLARKLQPGDRLTAKVYRDGKLLSLATTIGEKRKMGKVE